MSKILYHSILSMILLFNVSNLFSGVPHDETILNDSHENIASSIGKTNVDNLYTIIYILVFILILILVFFTLTWLKRNRADVSQKKLTDDMIHLLRFMPDMAVVYNKNLVILDIINPQADLLATFSNDVLVGYTLDDLAKKYPAFADASVIIKKNIKHTKETGEECNFTYNLKKGNNDFYSECKSVVYNNDRVLCFVKDVSANVIADKEIIKLKNFLQLIIDNLPVAVFVKDIKDNYKGIFYNANLFEFYGENSMIKNGDLTSDAINKEIADKYQSEDIEAITSDKPKVFNRTLYDKDGHPYRYGIATKRKLITQDGDAYLLTTLVDTTEIKKNELALENARNEITIALDAGSMTAWLYDVETKIFSSLYGETVSGVESTLESIIEILHPESQSVFNDFIQSILRGEYKVRSAILRFRKGDSYAWYESYASGIYSQDGTVIQIVGTQKDISLEIEKQSELKESKLKLELAFEAANIVMWDYDVEKDSLSSPSSVSILNKTHLSLDDYINYCVYEEYHKLFRDVMTSLIYDEIDEEEKIIKLKSIEGTVEWAQFTAKVISRNKNGRAIKIIGTRKFITKSVETANKLRESNFKTDLILKSSGIIQWDYDYTTDTFTSPDPNSFMYNKVSMKEYLSHIVEEDRHVMSEVIESVANDTTDRINAQVRLITQDEICWYDIDGVVLERDENGKAKKLTGFKHNINNFKNMTNELIILRDKAEEASRLKSAFLANMSHEIRTPLNAIVGFSNLVVQSDDIEEKAEFCKIIETNNELLLQLINDILDLSKIEAGQLEFIYAEMDVSDMMYGLEHIFKYRIKENVELKLNIPSEHCLICSEKNRITQVLVNFLSNASKFTSQGSITMGYEYYEKGLRFYVSDTGKGICAENADHVFERFAKFDSFVQGTGLGLSICKTIINKLNGEIGLNSKEGEGSTFWFTIPCQILHESELLEDNGLELDEVTITNDGIEKTILIAEDNYSNYMLLYNIFKKQYRIVHALNGVEAVKLYSEVKPDIIFMDVKMPQMDGFEATRLIREQNKTIPIVALTAHAYDNDREHAKEVGCNEYMTKPVDIKLLTTYLDQLFNAH